MSYKRQIKAQVIIFVVFLAAFTTTFLYLFQKNYLQFKSEIYQRGNNNLKIIDALSKIDTNVYIHKKALFRYVNTGNPKWMTYLKDAQNSIEAQFTFLEDYNKNTFQMWVPVENYVISNPKEELEKQIIEFQKGRSGPEYFQRLFYLVRYNLKGYFDESIVLVKKYENSDVITEGAPTIIPIDQQEAYVKLIYVGLNQLVGVYNNLFWDFAQSQNTLYDRNTNYYFRALMFSSVLLLFYAVFIMMRILRYFNLRQMQDETLIMLGAKDLTSGLFNRASFQLLAAREIERARRRGQHLSLLIFKVDPCDKIKADLGDIALDRFLYEVGESLLMSVRAYDGVYKYDLNTYVVLMGETDFKSVNAVVSRFAKKFDKKPFVIQAGRVAIVPQVSVGFSIYPTDGGTVDELVEFAMSKLTSKFDAYLVHQVSHPKKETEKKSEEAPAVKEIPAAENKESLNAKAMDAMFVSEPKATPVADVAQPVSDAVVTAPEVAAPVLDAVPAPIVDTVTSADATAAAVVPTPEPMATEQPIEAGLQEVPAAALATEPALIEQSTQADAQEVLAVAPNAEVQEPKPAAPEVSAPPAAEVKAFDDIPDIVAALSQPEVASQETVTDEKVAPEIPTRTDVKLEDVVPTTEIKVVNAGTEDVIMVDFDREPDDPALRFRKRIRENRLQAKAK